MAEKLVSRKAENLAKERGASQIEEADVVKGFCQRRLVSLRQTCSLPWRRQGLIIGNMNKL